MHKRLILIGPGDTESHYQRILNIDKKGLNNHINDIASSLINNTQEIAILPDKGICLEIAKSYKKQGGKNITALIPLSDKTFGTDHIRPNIEIKINNEPLFNNIIDTDNWYKQDIIHGIMGDAILYLGSSPGSDGELNYAIYLYRLLQGRKQEISVSGKFIHKDSLIDNNLTIYVYTPFLKNKQLSIELEYYIKQQKIDLIYLNSSLS